LILARDHEQAMRGAQALPLHAEQSRLAIREASLLKELVRCCPRTENRTGLLLERLWTLWAQVEKKMKRRARNNSVTRWSISRLEMAHHKKGAPTSDREPK
jgi:hypothetical protein